ncbi:2Fe-2S iron-sulfur cluster-binding protein (plasmid) [Rhodococcus erythropolis]|uniref:2Fe-2S iron-sulfur cluster-binding protein n=1 Tax=Rhodococcus erythropolis TaxID=1833 RepID=UPI00406BB444
MPTTRIHRELFRGTNRSTNVDAFRTSEATNTLSGAERTVELVAGDKVLESTLKNNIDAPYACLGGACALANPESQRDRYRWSKNIALTTAEVDAGYVLTCQAHSTTHHRRSRLRQQLSQHISTY